MTGAEQPEVAAFAAAQGEGLLRFAYLVTGGDETQAEDLVYAVLARLVERGLDGIANPGAYARTSIVNAHRSVVRRQSLHRRTLSDVPHPPPTASSPSDDRLTLLAALRQLNDRERAVVVLRYLEDLDDQAIATILGCSRPTVRSLAHRAMPKLRTWLADTYEHREEGSP
jgi:RNA polymerase sigma factor (sigma-70 family)